MSHVLEWGLEYEIHLQIINLYLCYIHFHLYSYVLNYSDLFYFIFIKYETFVGRSFVVCGPKYRNKYPDLVQRQKKCR